jgi:hypothetical protein
MTTHQDAMIVNCNATTNGNDIVRNLIMIRNIAAYPNRYATQHRSAGCVMKAHAQAIRGQQTT